jgi:NAD(P)H dehydrogenase (quinone)
MDTPKWYYFLININAGHNAMKIGVLEFCGIKPVEITSFAPVKSSDEVKQKNGWLKWKNWGESKNKPPRLSF